MPLGDKYVKTAIGIVEGRTVTLPEDVSLPEGARVLVEWDDEHWQGRPPLEREPLTEEDVRHDIEWATGGRWQNKSL